MKISAVIISFNEEKNIAEAIRSVEWAEEILVVDSESTDRTHEIAESLGAKVLVQKWLGFSKQKQFAVDQAENDWIFSLDADERVTNELKNSILMVRQSDRQDAGLPVSGPHSPAGRRRSPDGYKIPRLATYMNRQICHSGWYPDWQLRLFDRRKGKWKETLIHESVEMIPGAVVSRLKGDLLHSTVSNAAHHHRMIGERYAPLAAEQMFKEGKRTSYFKAATAGSVAFVRTYFIKAGFLDGFQGFCIARFAAHHAFLKHLLLIEMQERK